MTIERRTQVTAVVLVLCVVATILILFWSSRQVGQGIERIQATARIVQSAFMLRVLLADFLGQGNKGLLGQ